MPRWPYAEAAKNEALFFPFRLLRSEVHSSVDSCSPPVFCDIGGAFSYYKMSGKGKKGRFIWCIEEASVFLHPK